jgi:hypothetical protein
MVPRHRCLACEDLRERRILGWWIAGVVGPTRRPTATRCDPLTPARQSPATRALTGPLSRRAGQDRHRLASPEGLRETLFAMPDSPDVARAAASVTQTFHDPNGVALDDLCWMIVATTPRAVRIATVGFEPTPDNKTAKRRKAAVAKSGEAFRLRANSGAQHDQVPMNPFLERRRADVCRSRYLQTGDTERPVAARVGSTRGQQTPRRSRAVRPDYT